MSKTTLAIAALLLLGLGVAAERVVVASRGSGVLDLFDSVTGAPEGSVAVGASPVDLAPDSPTTFGAGRLFVANSGSNSVSVVQLDPLGVVATISGGGSYGSFLTPSGVARHPSGAIVVVDQKPTSYPGTPNGRSTIRFLSPTSFGVIDDYRDASPTARYGDVVATSNGKLWIADEGDQGVTVVRFPASAPPFFFPETLIYNGSGEFADFLHGGTAPAFLVAPRRLATDGRTVAVADAGSSNVTLIDADTQLMDHVSLGAGVVVNDVEIVGNFVYATSSGVMNLHRISLADLTLTSTAVAGTVEGLGASEDGTALFVGAGAGSGDIQRFDLMVPFPSAPTLVPAFPVPADRPFAFFSSIRNASENNGGGGGGGAVILDPPFVSQSNTTDTSNGSNNCGLTGLELLLLLGLRRHRRP